MLFKNVHLEGIKAGKITLAFRKWKKPAVKKGSLIKTAIGQVAIIAVSEIPIDHITPVDAANAGFENIDDLLKLLNRVSTGRVYKITVGYHSPDPRLALRNQTFLSETAFLQLKDKLERLDKYSKQGNWTLEVLHCIQNNPGCRARDLAVKTGKEKEWLKLNVRKLKNLGLTISLETGYTLSPLGETVLHRIKNQP